MALNEKEQQFISSIENKIKEYSVKTTVKECLMNSTGNFVETTYNSLKTEIVDAGIEHFICKRSFVYFLTNYAWVDIPGKGSEPFNPYYFQKELAREIQKYLKVVAFKTRQAGFSTLTSNYAFWKCNFYEGEYISIISKTQIAAQGFVGRFNTTMLRMPDFLKKKVIAQNTEKIVLQHPSGTLSTIRSESQSENAGRGDSISLLIMDEVAHYQSDRMVRKIVSSSGPALTKTGGQLLVISTPSGTSGAGQYYYEQVVNAQISKDKHTKLVTIDWWEIPDDPTIAGPKKGFNEILEKAIKEGYYYNQEIKSKYNAFFSPIAKEKYYENPWLRRQYEDSNEQSYRQEILHEFIVSGNMVFNKDVLSKIEGRIREPIIKNRFKTTEVDGLWIWKEPKPGKRYAMSCLPTGEKVLTNSGIKNIEDVSFDDLLIDKNGNPTKILNKQISNKNNEYVYKIKLSNILRETTFTGNHPILSSKKTKIVRNKNTGRRWLFNWEFNEAEDLSSGDWLIYPNMYKKNTLSDQEILSKFDNFKSGRFDFDIENPLLDEDMWWYFGMWLAEGWVEKGLYKGTISTTHNLKTETKYAEKITSIMKKYNRKVCLTKRESDNSLKVQFSCNQLSKFIDETFGRYAEFKKIPEWVKYIPDNFKLKFIEGYLNGDGSIFKTSKTYKLKETTLYNIGFVSISQPLLEGVQDILFSLGIISTLGILRDVGECIFPGGRKYKTKKTYQLRISGGETTELLKKIKYEYDTNLETKNRRRIRDINFSKDFDFIYIRIKNIEKIKYSGNVYNFETEDHTYLCKYITTHNCDVAKGTASDYSTFQIFDVEDYEQVCEYQNLLSTPAFARLIYMLANYYNQAYVIIESNGVGEAVFTKLYYDANESYANMYKEFKTNKKGETIATGWTTTEKSRQLITNNLIDWLTVEDLFSQIKIYSKRLYLEATTWIYNEKGKPIHASSSAHDDLLMALAFCLYLRDKAVNGGENFLISESGKMFSFKKDNISDGEENNISKAYSVVSDAWDGGDANSEEIRLYNWLIG